MHGKRIISALLALALCFAVTGCGGDVTPAASPSDSGQDGAEANPLVFGVSRQMLTGSLSLRALVDEYNASDPARPVELVYFDSTDQMLAAMDSGTDVDMYFTRGYTAQLAERSTDLSAYLDTELAPNLASALTGEDGLRALPFDFRINLLVRTVPGEVDSLSGVAELARENNVQLMYGAIPTDSVKSYFEPYILAADEEARADMLSVVENYVSDPDNDTCAMRPVSLSRGTNFGLTGSDYEETYIPGVPGVDTLGEYQLENVFGIFESCSDKDAAWDFLSRLYGDEAQSGTENMPATLSALTAYIEHESHYKTTCEQAESLVWEVMNGTTVCNVL